MIGIDIIKRSGDVIHFDTRKIVDAISKAFIAAEEREVEKQIDRQLTIVDLFAGVGGLKRGIKPSRKTIDIVAGPAKTYPLSEQSYIDYAMQVIANRMNGYDEYDPFDELYEQAFLEYERLMKRREELRSLRKYKTERISAMIKAAWQNRNRSVGRSSTSAVSDKMLLSIPTPPTAVAAYRSLERGGVVFAITG